jgi:hypothetical protein
MKRIALLVAILLSLPAVAWAADEVTIDHPWARASSTKVAGVFLTIKNAGEADRLIGASSPVAAEAMLHVTVKEGDVMKMRPVDGVDLPALGSAVLEPGGTHIMLMGLKQPLRNGDVVPVTLQFKKAGAIAVTVKVLAAGATGPTTDGMMDHDHAMGHPR